MARELTGEHLGGVRLDTLVINLVLPFLAASADADRARAAATWWRLWAPGDIAEVLLIASRQLATPGARATRTNETTQGLLRLHLSRTAAAASCADPGAMSGR